MYEKGNSKFFGKERGLLVREMPALVRAGIVISVVAGVFLILFATPAWAAPPIFITQSISGDPIDVNVFPNGRIEPYYDNWEYGYQYYAKMACPNGSGVQPMSTGKGGNNVLWLNGASTGFDVVDNSIAGGCSACTYFTTISNSKPDAWTIETVYDAGSTGVRITQRVEYVNGTKYYRMKWSIENTGSSTYTDLRFMHGGNTYFGGLNSSNGHYDSGLDMVYLTNSGVTGIMGLLGTPSSPIDHYYEDYYESVKTAICSGAHLPDTVNPSYLDAGYAVEWDRATLAPGQTWEIESVEKWTSTGDVQVFAPAGHSGYVGDTFDYSFTVQNLQSSSDTFNLSTSSSQGWPVSLPDGSTVTIGAGSSETVLVRVTATSVGTDLTTLTATSQLEPDVTNDDSVTTQANQPELNPDITKSAPTSVAPGGTITYTILYANLGPVALTEVTITENYPECVTFISADPAPDAGTNNMWSIGTLPAGASGQIIIKVKVPDSRDLTFTETGSVTGEGFVMVNKDLSTEQKPYRLKNVVTISCAETDPVTASASTTVSGVPGTSLEITEHGSGIYESEEILNFGTKNKSIRLQKSTEAEYQPTSFYFSDGFAVNFATRWMQDICSKNMVLSDAMHKKIKDATYIKDDTKTETGEYGTSMEFASSFHGAAHIGAVSKDVTTSEDYIGEFEIFWAAKEECQYLFNWSRVPGNDSEKLIRFLVDNPDINLYWAENATITKSDDDRIINIYTDWHSAEVILAANNETATVKVGNDIIYVLDVRTEDGTLNVYDCRLRKISESVTGEGYVMVDKELTSGHIQVVEHGSGIYFSDTDFDSQRLNKSTEAEYQPTTFNFSDDFSVNFSSNWMQGICSKDKKAGTAIHKKISDAVSMKDDTTATKSSMAFETSFNGSIHIGARTEGTRISEDYIGVFNLTEKIEIGKVVNASTATSVPDWLPCPFPEP